MIGRMLTLLVLAALAAPSIPAEPLLPAGRSWSALDLSAKKGLLRGQVELTCSRVQAEDADRELVAWPEGGRAPEGEVLKCTTCTSATFRADATRTTWLDARGLLQDVAHEGRRRSTRRFGVSGYRQWRRKGDSAKAPVDEKTVTFSGAPRPVIDVASLLWLAAAHRLERDGARLSVGAVSKAGLVPLDVRADDVRDLDCGQATVRARRVLIEPPESDEEHPATLLGMTGPVELYLDMTSGLPLELRGTVARAGLIRARVVKAVAEP